MALKLSDVVFRRTDLGTAGCPPRSHLEGAALLMGGELGWSAETREREIREVMGTYAPLPVAAVGE